MRDVISMHVHMYVCVCVRTGMFVCVGMFFGTPPQEIKDKQDVERLDSLISRAHQICVSLPLLSSLEQIQDTVKTWRLKLQAVLTNGSTRNTDLIPVR